MKKIFEYIGLFAIIAFSFYYTEQAATIVRNKNPIMQDINNIKDELKESSVNAIIENNTIIPGLYGKEVNVNKSFNIMKSFGLFNKYYLVYDDIIPEISLKDHKDKTIISGNPQIRKVALIIENNPELIKYFTSIELPINVLTTKSTYQTTILEPINNESKEEDFYILEKLLTDNNQNAHLCLTNTFVNIGACKSSKNFLIKPSLILKSNNLAEIKKSITNGSIIYIEEHVSLKDIAILLNQIDYQDLSIVKLSELIKEKQM